MRFRHLFLAAAALSIVYAYLNSVGFGLNQGWIFVGYYQETQLICSIVLALGLLAAWTVLEVAASSYRAGAMHCRQCGYSLAGVRCPECGHPAGASATKTTEPIRTPESP